MTKIDRQNIIFSLEFVILSYLAESILSVNEG